MNEVKRILVGLDFSEMDRYLIGFLKDHYQVLGNIGKVYFVHVERDLQYPKDLQDKMSTLPVDEQLEVDMINEVIAEGDDDFNAISEFEIIEGNPLEGLMRWTEIKKADLIVLGLKLFADGAGIVAQKLARKNNSSILFIPPVSKKVRKILVCIDFSHHSELVMNKAVEMVKKIPGSSLTCIHVYKVPSGYSKTGKSFKQAAHIMRGHAEDQLDLFLNSNKEYEVPIEKKCTLCHDKGYAESIYTAALEAKIDLIMMGSKGQALNSWIMLGSVAEKLIVINTKIPLYIVKKKDENFGFWEAIKQI